MGNADATDPCISDVWRDLSAGQRDVLVALARKGPASGADVHRRVRGYEPSTEPTTHRHLQELDDAGLVNREQVDGRENSCRLTDDGWQVVRLGVLEPAATINVREAEADE